MKKTFLTSIFCMLISFASASVFKDFQQVGKSIPSYGIGKPSSSISVRDQEMMGWPMDMRMTHSKQTVRGEYFYLTEVDAALYAKARIDQRKDIVRWLYEKLNEKRFDKSYFARHFESLCSSDIMSAVASQRGNGKSLLNGWEIFSLPSGYKDYEIEYEGNDWYCVKSDKGIVKLQLMLYGEKLLPVITGLYNPWCKINISISASTLARGYKLAELENYFDRSYCNKRKYLEFITNDVASFCKHITGAMPYGFVGDEALQAFRTFVVEENKKIVQNFYEDLTSSKFKPTDFNMKYAKHILYPIRTMIKDNSTKQNGALGGWNVFWNNSQETAETFEISYVGKNWYEIRSGKNPEYSVRVMPAQLTDKDHTPVIIGLHNNRLHIDKSIDDL